MVPRLHLVARILLGAIFVLSGISKVISPVQATDLLRALSGLDQLWARACVLGLSACEVILGVTLVVCSRSLQIAATVASLTLLFFVFFGLFTIENPVSCGCFGDVLDTKTDELFILRNLLFLVIALFVLRYSKEHVGQPIEGN